MASSSTLETASTIDSDRLLAGVFEPADGLLMRAIRRSKAILALCAVAGALAGLGIGLSRPSTYTASATLQVGQVNPNSPGFLGYVQSASSLATAFSRSVAAAPVLAKIDRTLHLSPAKATPLLSAEPIPLSPAFRVIATGSSATAAMRLANVTASAVIAYENKANSSNPEANSLLSNYREASLAVRQAESELANLSGSPPVRERAEATRNAAKVKLRAIENAYVAAVTSQAPREGLVSLLAGATSASSDRKSKLELYGFLGLLAGIAAGCAVAIARERRRGPVPA